MTARPSKLAPRPRPVPPRRPSGRAGFSIIELMVALTVLGLGILGIAAVFPLGSQMQVRDRMRTSGADLAQQKMEQLRNEAWAGSNMTDGVHPASTGETLSMSNEGSFNRRWTVVTQAGAFSEMKQVTVRVRWTFGRADSVELVSNFRK
ncbi:MAG: prepilin-type N-terminal cleavage/methylation domain-containing protein [Candidatus Eisenbacteria bacterium]